MVFENGVKNIQAAAYNGARTVVKKATKSTQKIQIAQPACKPVQISNSGS